MMKEKVLELLISDKDDNTHYCHIKDISKLLTHQVANYDGKRYFCRRCLSSFRKEEALEQHLERKNHQEGKIEMPIKSKNVIIKFQNYNRKMRMPFVMYGDFECFTEQLLTCKPSNEKSFTHKYQLHTLSGYGLYTKCFDDEVYSPKMRSYTATSRDDNVVDDFNLYLEMQAKGESRKLSAAKPLISSLPAREFSLEFSREFPPHSSRDLRGFLHSRSGPKFARVPTPAGYAG